MELFISVLIVLLILGVILWGVRRLPLDETIKQVIRVVAICAVMIWLILQLLPLAHGGTLHLR